jgi:hypothetical protein
MGVKLSFRAIPRRFDAVAETYDRCLIAPGSANERRL